VLGKMSSVKVSCQKQLQGLWGIETRLGVTAQSGKKEGRTGKIMISK